MRKTNPYSLSDKYMKQGEREIRAILSNTTLRVCSFDEINQPRVEKEIADAFKRINLLMNQKYRKIIKETYKSFGIILTAAEITTILAVMQKDYDPVTGYVYRKEWSRKRERLIEGILARNQKQDIRKTVNKHIQYILLMTGHYMDQAVDTSCTDAMRRNGVQQVMWVTQHDNKVCEYCDSLDGEIFDIDDVPDKAHYRCRCHLVPVS